MVKCESVGFKKQTINILMNVKPPKCEAGCLFKYKYGKMGISWNYFKRKGS